MRLASSAALVTLLVLGCKLDNPAFEGDEFAEDQATTESPGDEQDGSSTSESGDADHGTGDSTTLDGSSTATTTDDATTTTNDGATTTNDGSSSSDDATSTSTSTSEESTSEDTSDTFSDTLDGMVDLCPLTPLMDCKSCIQNFCCVEEGDMACIDGSDMECGCVLDCKLENNMLVDCGVFCGVGQLVEDHANVLYMCALDQCDQWCP